MITEKPKNVRMANSGEEYAIFDLLRDKLHSENGIFSVSPARAMETIHSLVNQKLGFIGIIEGKNNDIAGTIGIRFGNFWYTDDWHMEELWNFVHPDYRRSDYAKNLIDFGKWVSEEMKLILNIGIISTHRTEEKVRLYRRKLTPVGMFFMHNLKASKAPTFEFSEHVIVGRTN